jgi:hypothetical protein
MIHFLLYSLVQSNPSYGGTSQDSNPFSIYLRSLPIPNLPTAYSEEDLQFFATTSLAGPVAGKKHALLREFTTIKGRNDLHDISKHITLEDYTILDALIRSRSLEHPEFGEILVPVIDFVNHSPTPNCRYEISSQGITLLPIKDIEPGEELTISYGSQKSPLEMLFTYGFLPDSTPTIHPPSLRLEAPWPGDWDPMAPIKMRFLEQCVPRIITVARSVTAPHAVEWQSDSVWVNIVSEEDGFSFGLECGLSYQDLVQSGVSEDDPRLHSIALFHNNNEKVNPSDLRELLKRNEKGRWEIQRCLANMTVEPVIEAEIQQREHAANSISHPETNGDETVRDMARQMEKQEAQLLSEIWESLSKAEEESLEIAIVADYLSNLAEKAADTNKQETQI